MDNTNVLEVGAGSARSTRIAALDVVRGVAILGTLWTNIWLFTHTHGLAGYLLDPVTADTPGWAATTQDLLSALSQGKFLALLSMMFGMGLAIQQSAAARRGRRWPGLYLWRAALLFLDGAVNYLLIAEFDVLMGYAVTAALVSWMLLTSDRVQRWLVAGFAAAHVLLVAGVSALALAYQDQLATGSWTGPNPYADGSFVELVRFRVDQFVTFRAEPVCILLGTIAMFLLGARLFRAGVLGPEGGALRRRLLVLGALALPVDLTLGTVGGVGGLLLERYVVAPLVALGLLALLAELCLRRGTDGWLSRRLQEVGRTALSCYLLQNLLGGALFYGWGLGLAAGLGAWRLPATLLGYAVIVLAVCVFAHLWLRRFPVGPVEWLWKRAGDLGGATPRLARREP
ncbi:DUF418 domain-containing protein [Serinicoccus hydrothermalis]|uniref:DUF418 domain-containing protein n=1 Tax=Serinicoccus hydrothermalis TaxID=1758689 RepID=UPI000833A0B3|nr:DUF418 domain-containing protein [Serinicoccus hydrothermalis]